MWDTSTSPYPTVSDVSPTSGGSLSRHVTRLTSILEIVNLEGEI